MKNELPQPQRLLPVSPCEPLYRRKTQWTRNARPNPIHAVTSPDADFRTPKIGDKCSQRFNTGLLAAATRKNAPHRQGLSPAKNRFLIYHTKKALT